MFSPIGAPKENDDIDWLGDLKFFIDNDNAVLNRLIFPTIVKHERCVEEKDAYKLYYKPIKECLKIYIKKYDIVDADKKFPTGQLVELCKNIAEEQKRHIQNGDYKNESVYEDIHKGKERFLSSTKISESYEIAESVSVDAAIRSIVVAKDSNKLQALQRELAKRNIKLGESLAEVFDMFGPVSNLEMAVALLAVLSMPLAIIGPEVFDRIKNKIQKMSSRRIINLLSQKQIKADTATKKMIERLLYELQQSFDRNDGDQAKQIALRIQQIAKDTEDKKSVAAETIDTVKGGYKLVSEKTGDNLSTYPTRTGAVEAERRIQIFKSRDK